LTLSLNRGDDSEHRIDMSRSWSPTVPDLQPSPGSVIDARGNVRCIACCRSLRYRDAELVGLGWRCPECARLGSLAGDDEAVHLLPEERAKIRREPSPAKYALAGAALLAIAVVMWIARWDISFGRRSLFVYVFIGAVGLLSCGWFRWLDRRR
jgi:hypothetical protein